MKKKKKYIFMLLSAAVLFGAVAAGIDHELTEVVYRIETTKTDRPVTLAVISDLHSCRYGQGQRELLDAVDKVGPDAVLLTGDIEDDKLSPQNARITVKALAQKYPCFYVTGNHEFWSGREREIKELFAGWGVAVLEGECRNVLLNGQMFNICGIDDAEAGDAEILDQLESTREGRAKGAYTVLLAHRPERIQEYLPYRFDAVVSGHAHGGQWRIPGLCNGLWAPDQGFFPEYAGGRYDFDGTVFIVSRGLARESTRVFRLYNPPELVVLKIGKFNPS